MAKISSSCVHPSLIFTPSSSADIRGYKRPSAQQLFTAATGKRKRNPAECPSPSTFPAPLVLPGDEIALDPRYAGQSFRSWLNEPQRNEVTSTRSVLYIAAPPKLEAGLKWTLAQKHRALKDSSISNRPAQSSELPVTGDILAHLSAFYHGLRVEPFPGELLFKPWPDSKKSTNSCSFIGLATSQNITRIRVRPSPADVNPYLSPIQLNLNDILDVAIDILPADAYAVLLLINHDMYEDDDDNYCCGRAYGGSRVAVVSTARYAPELDEMEGLDIIHAWPASHCSKYIESLTTNSGGRPSQTISSTLRKDFALDGNTPVKITLPILGGFYDDDSITKSPMEAALAAQSSLPLAALSSAELSSIFLHRVVRTAAHEFGHCFGLDHCIYYACIMQGTASAVEDIRQPPYLCPVCLAKLKRAIAVVKPNDEDKWESERYKAIAAACSMAMASGGGAGFGALEAWTKGVLALR